MKPTHNDIIDAKEVYSQLSFEKYKGKLLMRNLIPSVYIHLTTVVPFNEGVQSGSYQKVIVITNYRYLITTKK